MCAIVTGVQTCALPISAARELHDVVDSEEIAGIAAIANQHEFLVEQRQHLFGHAIVESIERCLPDEMFEPILRIPALWHRFVRIFVGELIEREADRKITRLNSSN